MIDIPSGNGTSFSQTERDRRANPVSASTRSQIDSINPYGGIREAGLPISTIFTGAAGFSDSHLTLNTKMRREPGLLVTAL